MTDRNPPHVVAKVRSMAKTEINDPIQHVFAFGVDDIKLNQALYPGGCEVLGSQPVFYVAEDAHLLDAIIEIVAVAFRQQLPIDIWFNQEFKCTPGSDNGSVRVTDVQITRP